MHRSTPVWTLLAGLALHVGALTAGAQDPLPPPVQLPPPAGQLPAAQPAFKGRVETIPPGATRKFGMTTNAVLAKVLSENPRVIGIQNIPDDPTAVLVTGKAAGRSLVTLIDVKNNVEQVEFVVPDLGDKERRAALEKRRAEMMAVLRDLAPTAVIEPTVSNETTVIINGVVPNVEVVQPILEAARAFFPIVINSLQLGGVQQVQLEVVVAVVNRSEVRNLNFSFSQQSESGFFANVLGGPFSYTSGIISGPLGLDPPAAGSSLQSSPANIAFGITSDNTSFNGFLQALRTENLAKILADTRVTTMSGKPAYVVSGGKVPVLVTTPLGAPNVTYESFGTVVNFLPIVQGNKIYLEVRPELSSLNQAIGINTANASIPGFTSRSAQAAVQLEPGQTLAIGGLIQNTVNATAQKVPVLGDLPFLGAAFRSVSYSEAEEELLILVTPRLVDGLACTQIPKYLPGRETRTPDDFELFLEGILEAPRGPRAVSAHPREYTAAHKLAPGGYPCADAVGCVSGRCHAGVSSAVSPYHLGGHHAAAAAPGTPVAVNPAAGPAPIQQTGLTTAPAVAPATPPAADFERPLPPVRDEAPPVPVTPAAPDNQ